jgi:hypothetical protein
MIAPASKFFTMTPFLGFLAVQTLVDAAGFMSFY